MPQTSFALLTNLGRAKEAAALANATTIEITHIAIGDGATVPSGGETELYNEVDRKTISGHGTVVGADNVAYFDCYLAAGDGPYTIREAGLYDSDGDLIAIAHYDPPINKPVPSSGQTVEGTVRLEVAFSNIATVVIVVDPSIQVALQRLTRLPWIPIIELYRNAPPSSPAVGDAYVVGPSPTGSWTGNAGKVAEFTIAGWAMITPPAGHGVSTPDGKVYENVSGAYIEKIALDAQSGKWFYGGVAAGSANDLIVTLDPAPLAYTAGMTIVAKIAAANTGAVTLKDSTLNVAKNVVNPSGQGLAANDLVAGGMAAFVYDGTKFQLAWSQRRLSAKGPVTRILVISSSQTVTVQPGESAVFVEGWGGGGGGGGATTALGSAASGGGGGEYRAGYFQITPGQTISATIGAGGTKGAGSTGSNGADGGDTSFGSLMTCKGGKKGFGANGSIQATVGLGGALGSGGDINYNGFTGGVAQILGSSYLQAIGGYSRGQAYLPYTFNSTLANGADGALPGNGGGGGLLGGNGGNGFSGQLIATFYG